jgi:hypothetical protein
MDILHVMGSQALYMSVGVMEDYKLRDLLSRTHFF